MRKEYENSFFHQFVLSVKKLISSKYYIQYIIATEVILTARLWQQCKQWTNRCFVIKYSHLKRMTPNQVSADMKVVLGDDSSLQATVYRRVAKFQRVWQSTEDDHLSRHLLTYVLMTMFNFVQGIIQRDWGINIIYILYPRSHIDMKNDKRAIQEADILIGNC